MNISTQHAISESMSNPTERMVYFLSGMTSKERKRCKARSIKFPLKLMYALECGNYQNIITWNPSGLSFTVINPKTFEGRVLPEIFKEAKFASFQRKLMRWSFIKNNKTSSYSHPDFRRGDWASCTALRGDSSKPRGQLPSFNHQMHNSQPYSNLTHLQQNQLPHVTDLSSLSSSLATRGSLALTPRLLSHSLDDNNALLINSTIASTLQRFRPINNSQIFPLRNGQPNSTNFVAPNQSLHTIERSLLDNLQTLRQMSMPTITPSSPSYSALLQHQVKLQKLSLQRVHASSEDIMKKAYEVLDWSTPNV